MSNQRCKTCYYCKIGRLSLCKLSEKTINPNRRACREWRPSYEYLGECLKDIYWFIVGLTKEGNTLFSDEHLEALKIAISGLQGNLQGGKDG